MITTDDMLAMLKLARDEMNYTTMNTGCPARNSGLEDVRKGDLVRKVYDDPHQSRIRAVEYVAARDRDSYGGSSATYTVLERPNPLEGLGIGAVVMVDGALVVKTDHNAFRYSTSDDLADAKWILNRNYEVLSKGYMPVQ